MNIHPHQRRPARLTRSLMILLGGVCLGLVVLCYAVVRAGRSTPPLLLDSGLKASLDAPRWLFKGERLTLWWDSLPPNVQASCVVSGEQSNIHPSDYVGPDACKECHQRNYELWAEHPHHWMNALADETTVKGDFSGNASISYRGGRATFTREGGAYFMRLERGNLRRSYRITQTIGSRFYQYYVGKQLEGPEPSSHHFYTKDHVLPLGYWLAKGEWVPTVHIGPELPDEAQPDLFDPPAAGPHYAEYAVGCNYCHTTFPLADMLARQPLLLDKHLPLPMHWSVRPYLEQAHPEAVAAVTSLADGLRPDNPMVRWEASRYARTFGISCEACHLGLKAHVDGRGKVAPTFFPTSPHLFLDAPQDHGPTVAYVNWACGRCHAGSRPQFAAGMSTWNSIEYTDAMLGSCYSQMRCIDCHNPHQKIGTKWTRSAEQDDVTCLKCHQHLVPVAKRQEHTRHPISSEGSRCLNCHMPRINEGIQEVVRTHMIYSPTRADMLEANHPNACNLCHTDRPIDWTLRYLHQWYGKGCDEQKIAANYPSRSGPVALGWLESGDPAVRLVGTDALLRARDVQALPQLIDALDDPYLINRQFASKGLEEMFGLRLADHGYRFFMSAEDRRGPLAELRNKELRPSEKRP